MVRAAGRLRSGLSREAVLRRVRHDFSDVAERFPAAEDTAAREALGNELDRWLVAAGWARIEAYDEMTC